eukprot:GHVL01006516.1.p1 GENE.GHVL01006516.1~~GHVL01006516.1.p1  ORF type:complete len:240 (+),score=58.19 GHVL01006516.1:344-1063(+)
MLFQIKNKDLNRMSHCGVVEFTAEEGTAYVPYWLMQHLLVEEGQLIQISNETLPKGKYVKLQPVTSDFLDISDHRAVLERSLRNFATLTEGDNIAISYNDKTYEIEILETKPGKAVSIIETDVQVEFAPPKDYVEPPRVPRQVEAPPEEEKSPQKGGLFKGEGQRLDGKTSRTPVARKQTDLWEETEPWKKRIPGGVRLANETYDKMRREGKIPGVPSKSGLSPPYQMKNLFDGKGYNL